MVAARTHSSFGEIETAGQVARIALAAAEEASDTWAMGWALHVLSLVTAVQGQLAQSLPLSDRALIVTRSDPGLADLRLCCRSTRPSRWATWTGTRRPWPWPGRR